MNMKMETLASRFFALEGAPGTSPWDALEFLKWLCSNGLSHGELCSARFLLSVWNPGSDWVELAKDEEHPYPENAARFDLHESFGVWDREHRAAFLSWAQEPFYP